MGLAKLDENVDRLIAAIDYYASFSDAELTENTSLKMTVLKEEILRLCIENKKLLKKMEEKLDG